MNLKITGHHLEITDSLHDFIRQRFQRISRHFDQVLDTHVTLGIEHDTHRAEATIHVQGNHLHAHANGDDMYAAIDALTGKLDRQILKHKGKRKDHHQSQVTHHQPN